MSQANQIYTDEEINYLWRKLCLLGHGKRCRCNTVFTAHLLPAWLRRHVSL